MEENTEEVVEKKSSFFRDSLKPGLILAGALTVLILKGYVSAKLLSALIILDYFTYEFIKKLPVAVCFIIFMALTAAAAFGPPTF